MGFLPINHYQEYIRLKKIGSSYYYAPKCIYCKRSFAKKDYFIGNSRKHQFICRKCAERILFEMAIKECDKLKQVFQDALDDLQKNKDGYDKEEMLNNL